MNKQIVPENSEREYPHWGRVYVIVIVYATSLIIALWVFSRMFE